MPTPRETILAALHARLSALPATALRGEVLPECVPAAGLLILRDGEPGEPEVSLSPLRCHYQHRAEIETVKSAESTRLQSSGPEPARRAMLNVTGNEKPLVGFSPVSCHRIRRGIAGSTSSAEVIPRRSLKRRATRAQGNCQSKTPTQREPQEPERVS